MKTKKMIKKIKYNQYLILKKAEIAPDTFLLTIKGRIDFSSGQFVQIYIPHFGEATFAPCSNPEQKDHFDICVKNAGNVSGRLTEMLPGEKIDVRGPYGNGWPLMKMIGHNVILIAGGMGAVPMRPLLFDLTQNRSEFKDICFVGGFKTSDHVLFENELLDFEKKLTSLVACAEHVTKDSRTEKGLITEAIAKTDFKRDKTIVLICGPEIMYESCLQILEQKGIADENIYLSYERRMECGIGVCQHCNIGKYTVCGDGPVFRWDKIKTELGK